VTLTAVSGSVNGYRATDDLGTYRLYGLPSGTYVVGVAGSESGQGLTIPTTTDADLQWAARQSALPPAPSYATPPPRPQATASATVFFPSAIEAASAVPIELTAGAERTGVDITMRYVPVARVSGLVFKPDGQPALGATVVIAADSNGNPFGSNPMVTSRPGGRGDFYFEGVKPGTHQIMVQAPSSSPPFTRGSTPIDLWGQTSIAVNGQDITDVAITLKPGMIFSGRLGIDAAATAPAPDFTAARITLGSTSSGLSLGAAPAVMAPDGSFTISGIAPGSYRLSLSMPAIGEANMPGSVPVWMTKSVVIQGKNVLDGRIRLRADQNIDGVVITLTDSRDDGVGQDAECGRQARA
jgi:hypothetical protein